MEIEPSRLVAVYPEDNLCHEVKRKTWNEVIRNDLKERQISKDFSQQFLAKAKNTWEPFIKKPSDPCKHVK